MRVALLPCALLASCPAPTPTLDAFCASYTDAVCARLAECRGGPADAWCERVAKGRLCREVAASEAAGRTAYHGDRASACLLVVNGTQCRFLGARSAAELDVLCSETLSGLVAPQGTCFADRECGRDYHCDRGATRCPGVCRRLREPGESCDALAGTVCNTGFTCSAGTCMVPKKLGADCAESVECEAGLQCDAFNPTPACLAERSTGPCRPGGSDCAPRAACTGTGDAGTCAAAKQEGEACAQGQRECNELLSCVAGVCTRWGGLGAACGELSPNEHAGCLSGGCELVSGQSRGTCVLRDAGAPCELDLQCGPGGQCVGTPRVCMPRCSSP